MRTGDGGPAVALGAEAYLFGRAMHVRLHDDLGEGVGQIGAVIQRALTDLAMIEHLGGDPSEYRSHLVHQIVGVADTLLALANRLDAGEPIEGL